MSPGVWITLFGIIVGAVVTLSVASLHRKQIRQIELHRIDPTIPLVPPPHRYTQFLKTYGYFLGFGTLDIVILIRDMYQATPVTRGVVFDIVLDVLGVASMFGTAFVIAIFQRAARTAEKTIEIMEMMTAKIKQLESGSTSQANDKL
jgi:hypothetical protein